MSDHKVEFSSSDAQTAEAVDALAAPKPQTLSVPQLESSLRHAHCRASQDVLDASTFTSSTSQSEYERSSCESTVSTKTDREFGHCHVFAKRSGCVRVEELVDAVIADPVARALHCWQVTQTPYAAMRE